MPFGKPRIAYNQLQNLADIASEEYQDLVNCYFRHNPESEDQSRQNEVIKNLGFAQQGTNTTLPGAVRGLGIGSLTSSVGSVNGVYAAWDNTTPDVQVYLLGAGDPTSQGANARFVTNDTDVEFEQANNNLYVTNGTDVTLLLTASTGVWSNAAAATAPYGPAGTVAKYLAWHNYMMFAARTVNAPNILYVSDAGDPQTFTGPVTKTFRHKIVGMKSLSDYLMVYTEKEIWAVTGSVPSSLAFRQLPQAHPCVSHRSIVTVIGAAREYSATGIQSGLAEHWYLGADYVWATNGSTFRILGKESWEKYRANLSTAQLALAAAIQDDKTGQYWLSVPTGANTKNSVTWAYDPIADKWIERPFFYASCWTKHGSPTPSIYFLDANATGKAYLANSGNAVVSQKTTLNGAHTASVTTITVASTTGFPTNGVIQIENEAISYTGTTATTFKMAVRGYQGTTAASHADTTVVYPAMQFRYRTRNLDLGVINLIKKFQVLWINVLPSTTAYSLSVNVNVDQQGFTLAGNIPLATSGMVWGTSVWGSATWGSPSIILTPTNRVAIAGRGKSIKISLDESSSIQQTEVIQFELKSRPLKKK